MNLGGRNRALTNIKIGAAALFLVAPFHSQAEPTGQDWRIDLAPLRILASGHEEIGIERIVHPGDEIMRTAIGVPAAAELSGGIQFQTAGENWGAPAGTYMASAKVISSSAGTQVNAQRTFCGREFRSTGNRARVKARVRFCVTDADADGNLDHAFLVGARKPEDAAVRPITPVAYQYRENLPLPNSSLRVTFYKPPARALDFNGHTLDVRPTLFGKDWGAVERIHTRVGGKSSSFKAYQSVGGDSYPRIIQFGTARISILAFNKETSEMRVRVEHGFEAADFEGAYDGVTFI